jgi:hypothetical protein
MNMRREPVGFLNNRALFDDAQRMTRDPMTSFLDAGDDKEDLGHDRRSVRTR